MKSAQESTPGRDGAEPAHKFKADLHLDGLAAAFLTVLPWQVFAGWLGALDS